MKRNTGTTNRPSRTAVGGQRPEETHPLAPLVVSAVTALTLAVAFGLLALGIESFWVVFVVGFGGVLPMAVAVLSYLGGPAERDADRRRRTRDASDTSETALEALQTRYAQGEFTDEEFERRLERLLETTSETTSDGRTERGD